MSPAAQPESGTPDGVTLPMTGSPPRADVADAGCDAQVIADLQRLLAAERVARAAAEEALRRASFVADVTAKVLDSLDYERRITHLAQALVPTIGDWCAVDILAEGGGFRRLAVAHPDPARLALARELDERYPEDPASPSSRAQVLASGVPALVPEITDEMIAHGARDADHARLLRELRLRSFIVAPLVAHEKKLGTVTVVSAESGRRYGDADVALVSDLARRVGMLIEYGRLHGEVVEHRGQLERQAMELELQSAQLQETASELEVSNRQLQDTQLELEHQAEELTAANATLEEANAALARTARDLAERHAEAQAALLRADFLAHASELLAESLDAEETLRQVAALAVPSLADWCAVDLVDGNGAFQRLAVCHRDPSMVALARELAARYPDDPDAPLGRYQVLRSGEAEWIAELPASLLRAVAKDEEHWQIIESLGLRSYIAAPLTGRDGVIGVITFVLAESGRRYDERDLQLAVEVARRGAIAIENSRLVAALQESRDQLQEQAAELEMQTEELEATAAELRQQTDLSEEARRLAEEANRAKSQFLATMSHELRTPLNAISGYVDLLAMELRGPVTEPQREDLERIRRSGHHLLSLINDILNFARLEAGQVEFHTTEFAAGDVLEEVEPLILPQLGAKGLSYEAGCADPSLGVRADPEKVRQVLINLLSNALKFTPAGGTVRLRCQPGTTGTGAPMVAYVVSDSGRGIPAEQLDRIFEPFVQVDRHLTTHSQQGVGLGLAISRDLARAMGGDLTATSVEGEGSAFTLLLPAV